ncbi:MAG: acyl-CoA-binding protein [Candidatus Hodarchaeales archaeon]|jgi:acyl-CoA-binding protein
MSNEINFSIKTEFDDILIRAKNLPNQPPEVLLEMYGLYKQAHNGDVSGKRPGRMNLKARYKYDSWAARKGMTKEDAMKAYINLVKKVESS